MNRFFNYPFSSLLRVPNILVAIVISVLLYLFLDLYFAHFVLSFQKRLLPICKFVAFFFNGEFILPFLVILFLASFVIKKLKPWQNWLFNLLFCLLIGQIFLILVKPLIGRARPYIVLDLGTHLFKSFDFSGNYFSFPSGHTINIMIMSGLLAIKYATRKTQIICLGLMISFFRVINNLHFLSDWFLSSYIALLLIAVSFFIKDELCKFKIFNQLMHKFKEIT